MHELVYLDGQAGRVIENAMGAPGVPAAGQPAAAGTPGPDLRSGRAPASTDQDVYVAVLQAEGRKFGLVVDRVLNTEEVVVKPLTARFKDIGVYAGATILGDGRVALILDVASLARRSHLNVAGGASGPRRNSEVRGRTAVGKTVDRLLIAGVGGHRVAIPLDMVTRLEEFAVDKIERAGSREVVQYREQILPVVRLSHLLGSYEEAAGRSDAGGGLHRAGPQRRPRGRPHRRHRRGGAGRPSGLRRRRVCSVPPSSSSGSPSCWTCGGR